MYLFHRYAYEMIICKRNKLIHASFQHNFDRFIVKIAEYRKKSHDMESQYVDWQKFV